MEEQKSERADWSDNENRLIVADYFTMLEMELRGEGYSKTEHRNVLSPHLSHRSKGSIEFKHQNISAVLVRMGLPYIQGYKPRHNIQRSLAEQVDMFLLNAKEFDSLIETYAEQESYEQAEVTFNDILDSPPDMTEGTRIHEPQEEYKPRKINFAKRESENRSLGLKGEEFVVEFEKARLLQAGRTDLAKEVLHVSKEQGDGAGFDILSFTENNKEMFIEVKTTREGKELPFYMSSREKNFLEDRRDDYYLYRLFNFERARRMFVLGGNRLLNCHFDASQFRVSFYRL